ncbi:hypothetical protein [uncultured Nostoc sp.]|uniref:hypothetical protein n=1 Tax=uncultured Nostoc sp. TaxID=340711 RepID=UPI0035C96CBB
MGSLASGRPGGNPEFGKTIKRDAAGSEPLERLLNIRITPSMDDFLKSLGDRRLDFVREAIAEKLGRELAAQTEVTKTETTELVTGQGQQLGDSQTTQLNLELATDPTPSGQVKTPKTRRKAGQTQGHKLMKPTTQTRSQKSSATEKTTEQGQLDTGK